MAKAVKRRRSRGRAWYWQQTDSWYYTPPGTRNRVRLLGLDGLPLRGPDSRDAADLALARIQASGKWRAAPDPKVASQSDVVARVCSEYLVDSQRRVERGEICDEYFSTTKRYLNAFAAYCGAVPVGELKKAHVDQWLEGETTWKSNGAQRHAITAVIAAFRFFAERHDVPNPLKGLRKPPPQPRLHSLSPADETRMYAHASRQLRDFLFAALHTGLRPFCELARLTAAMVEETPRGMVWRVYSSKTKKTRKIPVRRDVAELTRSLLASHDGGPIFRTPQGNPWRKALAGKHFRALRHELGWQEDPVRSRYSCYTCRHTFAHRMLSGHWNNGVGCSIETLAELMGDTPKTAFDHYGREWGQHYQEPLWAALGVPPLPAAKLARKTRHN